MKKYISVFVAMAEIVLSALCVWKGQQIPAAFLALAALLSLISVAITLHRLHSEPPAQREQSEQEEQPALIEIPDMQLQPDQMQRHLIMEELVARLLLSPQKEDSWNHMRFRAMGFPMDNGPYGCIMLTLFEPKKSGRVRTRAHILADAFVVPEGRVLSSSAISDDVIVFVLYGPGVDSTLLRSFASQLSAILVEEKMQYYISISSLAQDYSALYELYSRCRDIADYQQFVGWSNSICTLADLPPAEHSFNTAALKQMEDQIRELKLNEAEATWHLLLSEERAAFTPEIFSRRRLPYLINTLAENLETVRYLKGQDCFDGQKLQDTLAEAQTVQEAEAIAAELFLTLRRSIAVPTQSEELSDRVRHYLETHYQNPELNVSLVADELGLSLPYLSSQYKKQTGQGVLQQLHILRVREAVRLLRETELTIKDIAARVGYASSSTMLRAFTRLLCLSPQQYRSMSPEEQLQIQI